MRKEISVKELESTISLMDDIQEPIIVKRKDKQDLVVISLEQYKKELFLAEISSKLEKSEKELEQGKVHSARHTFKELREKYGYESL